MKREHRNIEIEFLEHSAKFAATVKGKRLTAPSLEAIKKKIDGELKGSLEPFSALECVHLYKPEEIPKLTTIRVVRLDVEKSRFATKAKFIFEYMGDTTEQSRYRRGEQSRDTIVCDTPDARKAIQDYYKIAVEAHKEKERLDAMVEEARSKIPFLTAEEFMKQRAGA